MSWEVQDLPLFLQIKLPDLLLTMSQENISVHDIAIRYCPRRARGMVPTSGVEWWRCLLAFHQGFNYSIFIIYAT